MIDRLPLYAAHQGGLTRGCLVRLEPGAEASSATLEFPFNPESVTRSRTGRWDPRRTRRSTETVATPQQVRGGLGAHGAAALLAQAETISFRLVLDATETILRAAPTPGDPAEFTADAAPPAPGGSSTEVGVLPELAFLEQVSIGRDVEEARTSRTRGTQIQPVRPDELLLQLGSARWFPCVLTELTITEQKFTPALVPIRAEVDVKLTVLEPVENAYNPLVRQSFDQLLAQRARNAAMLGSTASTASLQAHLGGSTPAAPGPVTP